MMVKLIGNHYFNWETIEDDEDYACMMNGVEYPHVWLSKAEDMGDNIPRTSWSIKLYVEPDYEAEHNYPDSNVYYLDDIRADNGKEAKEKAELKCMKNEKILNILLPKNGSIIN